jgi:hypothetical protein
MVTSPPPISKSVTANLLISPFYSTNKLASLAKLFKIDTCGNIIFAI